MRSNIKSRVLSLSVVIIIIVIIAAIVALSAGWILYNESEMMEYINHNTMNENRITGLVYNSAGEDSQGGFINYTAIMDDGSVKHLRVNVTFRKTIFFNRQQTGPKYKIKGFEFEP